MNKKCWIQPPSVQTELKRLFQNISNDVSSYYESNSNMREEHIESRLATLLETANVEAVERLIRSERINKNLEPIKIHLSAKHITKSEQKHGADVGLVTRIQLSNEMVADKAALIQGKKLVANKSGFNAQCTFVEMFKEHQKSNLGHQWDRMLNVTASSVYLLYGPPRMRIKNSVKEYGIRVISAQVVGGIYAAGRTLLTAEDAFDLSKPFSSWLVEEFICCSVGDTKQSVIETALGGNSTFPTRHVFEIDISADKSMTTEEFTLQ